MKRIALRFLSLCAVVSLGTLCTSTLSAKEVAELTSTPIGELTQDDPDCIAADDSVESESLELATQLTSKDVSNTNLVSLHNQQDTSLEMQASTKEETDESLGEQGLFASNALIDNNVYSVDTLAAIGQTDSVSESQNSPSPIKAVFNFLEQCDYEIMLGLTVTTAQEPYNGPKVGLNIGATGRRNIMMFNKNKTALYGIVGLFLTKRGGFLGDNVLASWADLSGQMNWVAHVVSLPVHVGVEHTFSKRLRWSVFADLGPNVLFNLTHDEVPNRSMTKVALGSGLNMGIRFKSFAIAFGFEFDLTKLGTFTPDDHQAEESLGLKRGLSYNLKTGASYIVLRWTL